jgi:hypothetical protein
MGGTGGTISARYDAGKGSYISCAPVEAIAGLISKTQQVPVIHFENFATVPAFEIVRDDPGFCWLAILTISIYENLVM